MDEKGRQTSSLAASRWAFALPEVSPRSSSSFFSFFSPPPNMEKTADEVTGLLSSAAACPSNLQCQHGQILLIVHIVRQRVAVILIAMGSHTVVSAGLVSSTLGSVASAPDIFIVSCRSKICCPPPPYVSHRVCPLSRVSSLVQTHLVLQRRIKMKAL